MKAALPAVCFVSTFPDCRFIADMVDCRRLMEHGEEGKSVALNAYCADPSDPLIAEHKEGQVEFMGDSAIARIGAER